MASVIVILSPLLKALSVLFHGWVGGGGRRLRGAGFIQASGWLWKCSDWDAFRRISRLSTRLKTPFTTTITALIPPIIPPPYLQKTTTKKRKKEGASSFSATGSLTLLWPYWACAGAARGGRGPRSGSTLLNALTQDDRLFCFLFFFFLVLLYFHDFVMLLGSYSF